LFSSERSKTKFLLPHNFAHKYEELYSNDSRINEVVEIPINEKQSIYHAKIIQNQN